MNDQRRTFFEKYFNEYRALAFESWVEERISEFAELAIEIRNRGGRLFFAGNGASASFAEHGAVDFTKQGNVLSHTFHDPNLITCFANDYGYDQWIAKAIGFYANTNDAVVLASVSGESPSVVEAAKAANTRNLPVVAFTGRSKTNRLRQLAQLSFHVDSHAYNIVECIHQIWLTATIDYVIGHHVYETRTYSLSER